MPLPIGNRSIYMKITIYRVTIDLTRLDSIRFLGTLIKTKVKDYNIQKKSNHQYIIKFSQLT